MRRLCPTISELNAFHASAKHLTFTLAAREMCVTQGAISRHVASLEAYLGQQLFVRRTTGLELTESGATYLNATQPAMSALEIATAQLRAQGSAGGMLNLSVPPTFATQWLLPRMGEFRRALPHFTLNFVRYQHVHNYLGPNEFDAAIAFGNGHWPNAVAHYITGREQSIVCTPQLRDSLPLHSYQDLQNATLLQHIEVPMAWHEWLSAHDLDTGSSRFGPGFTQYALIMRAAQAGFGVGIVPTCVAEHELQSGTLIEPFEERFQSQHGYYLCTSSQKSHLPAFRMLRDWLEHCCQHATAAQPDQSDPVHLAHEDHTDCIFCHTPYPANGQTSAPARANALAIST